jgi:hypothetical protein
MKPYLYVSLLLLTSLSYTPLESAPAGEMVVFAGQVSDPSGRPVPGAAIELCDPAGKIKRQVLTDIEGKYRFPAMPADSADTGRYRISVSHLKFEGIKPQNLIAGATSGSPVPRAASGGRRAAAVTYTRLVSRNFILSPASGPVQNAVFDPSDPNLAEYYYRKAHLLWDANHKAEAIELFRAYAQVGMNINHVAAALDLVARAEQP